MDPANSSAEPAGRMRGSWPAEELRHLAELHELEVARVLGDGRPGRWLPIWVVVAGDEVLVRTWQRRDTGWYGAAVVSGRLWVRSPGERLVAVAATGAEHAARVAAAYRAKYGATGAVSMVTAEAAASTLRLTPIDA